MAIRKKQTARRSERESKGRHPLLKLGSFHYMIWQSIKAHPDSTRNELIHRLGISGGTLRPRVKELLDEGLLYESGRMKRQANNRQVPCLRIAEGHETGSSRDTVQVDFIVFENSLGEFSVSARVFGQAPSAEDHGPIAVAKKSVRIPVPKKQESVVTRQYFDKTVKKPIGKRKAQEPLTIDVEYEMIEGN